MVFRVFLLNRTCLKMRLNSKLIVNHLYIRVYGVLIFNIKNKFFDENLRFRALILM